MGDCCISIKGVSTNTVFRNQDQRYAGTFVMSKSAKAALRL